MARPRLTEDERAPSPPVAATVRRPVVCTEAAAPPRPRWPRPKLAPTPPLQ